MDARVIKIGCTEGDYSRGSDAAANGQLPHLVWTNRGKESFFMDFKNSDDATVLHRLLAEADVLVQTLPRARWGGLG
nr:CoA transferase [Burkholderia ubonensis]